MAKGLPYTLGRANPATLPAVRKLRYAMNNTVISVTGGAATALGFGSVNIGGLPEGNLLIMGTACNVRFFSEDADVIEAWDGDFSFGTTATADATLATTEINLIASTSIGAATAKLSPIVRATGPLTSSVATSFYLDNTDKTLSVFLNMLTDDNSVTDSLVGDFKVTGFLDIVCAVLGDD